MAVITCLDCKYSKEVADDLIGKKMKCGSIAVVEPSFFLEDSEEADEVFDEEGDALLRTQAREVTANFDLRELNEKYHGVPYSGLVQSYLRDFGTDLEAFFISMVEAFDENERDASELLIDELNLVGSCIEFGEQDCAEVLALISNRFSEIMTERGLSTDYIAQFIMFQFVTMNFAYMAREQKEFRKFAGIKKGRFFT